MAMHSVVSTKQAITVPISIGCLLYGSMRLGVTPSGGSSAGVVWGSREVVMMKIIDGSREAVKAESGYGEKRVTEI